MASESPIQLSLYATGVKLMMFQEGRDRYQRVINHPDAAPITIFSAQKSLRQISADNSRWAMVKEAKNGGTGQLIEFASTGV